MVIVSKIYEVALRSYHRSVKKLIFISKTDVFQYTHLENHTLPATRESSLYGFLTLKLFALFY